MANGTWSINPTTGITRTGLTSSGDLEIVFNKRTTSTQDYIVQYKEGDYCGQIKVTQEGGSSPEPPTPGCDSTVIGIKLVVHNNTQSTISNFSEIRFIINSPDTQGRYILNNGTPYTGYMRLPSDGDPKITLPSDISVSSGGQSGEISISPSWPMTLYNSSGQKICSEAQNGLKYRQPYHRINGSSDCYGAMLYHDGHTSYEGCLLLESSSSNPTVPSTPFTFEEGHTYHLYILR